MSIARTIRELVRPTLLAQVRSVQALYPVVCVGKVHNRSDHMSVNCIIRRNLLIQ